MPGFVACVISSGSRRRSSSSSGSRRSSCGRRHKFTPLCPVSPHQSKQRDKAKKQNKNKTQPHRVQQTRSERKHEQNQINEWQRPPPLLPLTRLAFRYRKPTCSGLVTTLPPCATIILRSTACRFFGIDASKKITGKSKKPASTSADSAACSSRKFSSTWQDNRQGS